MPRRRIAMLLLASALAAPAAAHAHDPSPSGGTPAPAEDAGLTASAHVLLGKVAEFSGSLPADAGGTVTIERLDRETAEWIPIATAVIGADGTYNASWRADVTGRLTTRVTVARPVETGAAAALAAPAETTVTVYRSARATWYGPGFYGRRTACGQRMTRTLLGVAHRRLPCGTEVAITYQGKAITVPVVDRGPFKRGRRWDLTAAAAAALDFTHTDRIGAIPVE
jgi:peptidoglycan lytic transglycosylase